MNLGTSDYYPSAVLPELTRIMRRPQGADCGITHGTVTPGNHLRSYPYDGFYDVAPVKVLFLSQDQYATVVILYAKL